MLSLLLLAAALSLVYQSYGYAFLGWVSPRSPASPFLGIMIGLALSTGLATALSLVMPLSAMALGILALPAALLWIWRGRDMLASLRAARPQGWMLLPLAIFALAVLHNAVLKVANFDSGLYHVQSIQWLETFPAVPGLANLHGRLGFNSSWFVANAWPSLGFLQVADFHPITAILFFVTIGAMLLQLPTLMKNGPERIGLLFGIFIVPAAFYAQGTEIASPGTDLPTTLMIWACTWIFLTESDSPAKWITLLLVPLFAVTIKLAAIPLLGFSLVALIALWQAGNQRAIRAGFIAASIIVLPWLARNVILTGYLLFPQTLIDVFAVDWKVPLGEVAAESDAILAWGRLPRNSIDQTIALPFSAWFPLWFANLSEGQKALALGAFTSPLPIAALAWLRPTQRKQLGLASAVLVAGVLYWLFSAPAIRFGYGYLIGLLALTTAGFLDALVDHIARIRPRLPLAFGVLISLYITVFLVQSFDRRVLGAYAVYPAPYPALPTAPCQIQNATIMIGQEYGLCWDTRIPCAPYCKPELALRGNTLAEGFYIP